MSVLQYLSETEMNTVNMKMKGELHLMIDTFR
jgi:hypothetical protein